MDTGRFSQEGPVPKGQGHVYVRRAADDAVFAALLAGRDIHVSGSRQAGKSSLIRRAISQLQEERPHLRAPLVDFQAIGPEPSMSYKEWFRNFSERLLSALTGSIVTAGRLLETYRPENIATLFDIAWEECGAAPTVLVLEEFDALERFPAFARTLLGELRALQHAATHDGLQMSLVTVKGPLWICRESGVAGPTEIDGELLWLDDFNFLDPDVVATVAEGFVPLDPSEDGDDQPRAGRKPVVAQADLVAGEILKFTGGAPKPAMWLAAQVAERGLDWSPDLPRLIKELVSKESRAEEPPAVMRIPANYIDEHPRHLRRIHTLYRDVLSGDGVTWDNDDQAQQILRWSGLCRVDGRSRLVPRCEFYLSYFNISWVRGRLDRIGAPRTAGPRHARRSSKRVAVLLTGGTVGMLELDDGRVSSPDDPADLVDQEPFQQIADVEFVPMEFSLDSADIHPRHWREIATTINRLRASRTPDGEGSGFDGFVVAHGTDTLAYSASATSFAFGRGLDFPIVFTGAQTTPDVAHGDATSNLLRAVLTATYEIPEVVVAFGEYVLRACRTQKKDDRRFDAFESPGVPPIGIIAEDVDVRAEFFRRNRVSGPPTLRADFSDGILQVVQTPGSFPEFFMPALDQRDHLNVRRCKGVVVQSLGAGNIPVKEAYSLVPLIQAAREREIPVMLTSSYPVHLANITRYSPALEAVAAGGFPTGNMTLPAVVAKLSWSLANVERRIEQGELAADQRVQLVETLMRRNEVDEVGEIRIATAEADAATGPN